MIANKNCGSSDPYRPSESNLRSSAFNKKGRSRNPLKSKEYLVSCKGEVYRKGRREEKRRDR